jgi:ribonuclease HII
VAATKLLMAKDSAAVAAKKIAATKKIAAKTVAAKKVPAKKVAAKAKPAAKKPVVKRKLSKKIPPSLSIEKQLWDEGFDVVVGLDEVGRGSWAGPLAIGAVVLPVSGRVNGVRDSKMLTEREREALYGRLAAWCRAWSVGMVSHAECDEIGMSAAQKLAARRALDGLGLVPDRVLIDGNWDFVSESIGPGKCRMIVKGDATCLSISTASVLAKVTRDRLMRLEDEHFPAYNFAENKGYPCPRHKMALQAHGPSTIHRRSWVFMDHLPWGIPRVVPPGLMDQQTLFD